LIQILSIKRFDAAVPRLPGKSAGRINLISGTSNTPVAAAGRPRMPGKPLVRGFSCLPRVNAFFRAPGKERPGGPRTKQGGTHEIRRLGLGRRAWNGARTDARARRGTRPDQDQSEAIADGVTTRRATALHARPVPWSKPITAWCIAASRHKTRRRGGSVEPPLTILTSCTYQNSESLRRNWSTVTHE